MQYSGHRVQHRYGTWVLLLSSGRVGPGPGIRVPPRVLPVVVLLGLDSQK